MIESSAFQQKGLLEEHGRKEIHPKKSLVDKIIKWNHYVNKWKVVVSIVLLSGAMTGAYRYLNFTSLSTTYLIANTNYLSRDHVQLIVEGLQNHLDQNNYQHVSDKLGVTLGAAQTLRKVHCQFVPRKEDKNMFKLTVEATSNAHFSLFETTIFNYIENLKYVKENMEREKEQVELRLVNLNKVLLQLDSMEYVIRSNVEQTVRHTNSDALTDGVVGYAGIVNQKLNVKEQQFHLQSQLSKFSNFEVIQGFEEFSAAISPSFFRLVFPPLFISLLLCYGFIWTLELREEVIQRNRIKRI